MDVAKLRWHTLKRSTNSQRLRFYSVYIYIYCGGVKPGPMRWAQEQRFINNTSEEKKS